MAYSTVWDETAPLGSVAANTIDTIVQNMKRDLRERLNEAFIDFTADPVVLKSTLGPLSVSVYHSANHGDSSITPMAWDSERYDTSAFHDLAVNNSRLTVPAGKGGLYLIHARILVQTNVATTTYGLRIKKNGATFLAMDRKRPATTNVDEGMRITCIEQLVAGDYVEAFFQKEAGADTGNDVAGISNGGFEMVKIGGVL